MSFIVAETRPNLGIFQLFEPNILDSLTVEPAEGWLLIFDLILGTRLNKYYQTAASS